MDYRELAGPIEGYKVVDDDLSCTPNGGSSRFQFEIGVRHILPKFEQAQPLELCERGFHFCKAPSGGWAYRSSGRLFKVRAWGVLEAPETPGADYKLVARELMLVEEIKFDGHQNTGYENTGHRNTGDQNTGHRNTGDRNTGYENTGNWNTGIVRLDRDLILPKAVSAWVLPVPGPPVSTTFWAPSMNSHLCNWRNVASLISLAMKSKPERSL